MKRKWGAVVLLLTLASCYGDDQFIVDACQKAHSNTIEHCTCFRDGLKRSLNNETYEAIARSAAGKNEEWRRYFMSLSPDRQSATGNIIVMSALNCQANPWDELGKPLMDSLAAAHQ